MNADGCGTSGTHERISNIHALLCYTKQSQCNPFVIVIRHLVHQREVGLPTMIFRGMSKVCMSDLQARALHSYMVIISG